MVAGRRKLKVVRNVKNDVMAGPPRLHDSLLRLRFALHKMVLNDNEDCVH